MGEDGDEDSDVAFAFRCAGAESIASPPFAQNAKDGPPATRRHPPSECRPKDGSRITDKKGFVYGIRQLAQTL